jgi:phospholipid/cholesterol/gamma-HCH transport system permease protein
VDAAASAPPAARLLEAAGRQSLRATELVRELGAFALITLGAGLSRLGTGARVIRPLVAGQIWAGGVRLLPTIAVIALALGLVVIGQSLALLTTVGAESYIGIVMVAVVVRELGPLLTAILVVARSGTSTVVELGTVRALGEVEALESLGIDPIHYLVVPRVVALATSVFCLTMYFVLIALVSGWVFAFVRDVPLQPGDYFGQLAANLRWQDFALLFLKTGLFGMLIGIVSCYHGLGRALRVEEVSRVTTRAVVESVVGCALLDAAFLAGYVFV